MTNWSDFLATPPTFGPLSASSAFTECIDPAAPMEQDGLITTEQYERLFPPSQAPPPVAPTYGYSGMQYTSPPMYPEYSELDNRALCVSNLHPDTTQEEIKAVFDQYNGVRSFDFSTLPQGYITVEYFDLRHAQAIRRTTAGRVIHGNEIAVAYAPLPRIEDPKKPPNNGTIVVFHLPSHITTEQIGEIFGQFGEIRQIRGTPSKPTQRFIEYWDIRAAEAALNGLSWKYVMGSRVSIEYSLPGGFRRNAQTGPAPPRT